MRRISMAGSDIAVTDDRIAELVLEYAMLLGRAGTTDAVTIPVAEGGGTDEASLLLGPASQISITANDELHLERVHLEGADAAIELLQERIAAIGGGDGTGEEGVSGASNEPGRNALVDPAAAFLDLDEYLSDLDQDRRDDRPADP